MLACISIKVRSVMLPFESNINSTAFVDVQLPVLLVKSLIPPKVLAKILHTEVTMPMQLVSSVSVYLYMPHKS